MKKRTFVLLAASAFAAGMLSAQPDGEPVGEPSAEPSGEPSAEPATPDKPGGPPGPPPPDHKKPDEVGVIAKEKRDKEYAKGNIDYHLLRSTQVEDKPPPIYTDTLKKLDGKTVKVHGFMAPYDDLDDMRNVMLFPFPVGCFFCAPPSIQEVIFVRQDTDKKAPFIDGAIEVTGKLLLWSEESEDEAHEQRFLYVMDKAKVKAVKGAKPGKDTKPGKKK